MTQTVKCPACGRAVEVGARFAGKRIRCPACKCPIDVPGAGVDEEGELRIQPLEPTPVADSRSQGPTPPSAPAGPLDVPRDLVRPRARVRGVLTPKRSGMLGAGAVIVALVVAALIVATDGAKGLRGSAALVASAACFWGVMTGVFRRSAFLSLAGLYCGAVAATTYYLWNRAVSAAAGLVASEHLGWSIAADLVGGWGGLILAGATFGALWGLSEGPDVGPRVGAKAGARAGLWGPIIPMLLSLALIAVVVPVWILTPLAGTRFGMPFLYGAAILNALFVPAAGYIAARIFAGTIEGEADAASGAFVIRSLFPWQRDPGPGGPQA